MPPPPTPPPRRPAHYSRQLAVAMEMPFALVGAVLIGGGMGYLLDNWLGTTPFLMLILGAMGFYAGVREVMRRLAPALRKPGPPGAPSESPDNDRPSDNDARS